MARVMGLPMSTHTILQREKYYQPTSSLKALCKVTVACSYRCSLTHRCDEFELLCNLLFWQEVTEYGKANMKTLDSKIHAAHTWDIYNKYITTDALFNIGSLIRSTATLDV
jgi:hypothetical protein